MKNRPVDDDKTSHETTHVSNFEEIEELSKESSNPNFQGSDCLPEKCSTNRAKKIRKNATYYLKQLSHLYYEREHCFKDEAPKHPVITFKCRAGRLSF